MAALSGLVLISVSMIWASSAALDDGVIASATCGGVLTQEEGAITSNGYPNYYGDNLDCTWTIEASENNLIQLTVDHFALQHSTACSQDYLVIEGVDSSAGSYCGSAKIGTLRSVGNVVTLHFVTDASTSDTGFSITYKQIPKPNCDGGDAFCANGGTCDGDNLCLCDTSYLGYRCAYEQYGKSGVETPASGIYTAPSPTCVLYGLGHVATFDGATYQFSGTCAYVLSGTEDRTTQIVITAKEDCGTGSVTCVQGVTLYSGSVNIVHVEEGGAVTFGDMSVGLPYSKYGFSVYETSGHIVMTGDKYRIEIEISTFTIRLTAQSHLAGSLTGLCGDMDGDAENEFGEHGTNLQGFIDAWHLPLSERTCAAFTATPDICNSQEATVVCNVIYSDAFATCRGNISVESYYEDCLSDVCRCGVEYKEGCHCAVVSKYARYCTKAGFPVDSWRTPTSCGQTCPANQEYSECGCLAVCSDPKSGDCGTDCLNGCQCPSGLFWDGSACVAQSQCPCNHAGQSYAPGETMKRGCDTCTCEGSMWSCKPLTTCPATALVMGFGNVRTFDGTWFDFPGAECQYLFAEDFVGYTFTVYISMDKCGFDSMYSCVKSIKVIASDNEHSYFLVLGNDDYVSVQNDVETTLPANSGPIHAYKISHIYTEVSVGTTGVRILWRDGTVIMTLPSTYEGKVRGLAGDLNRVTTDDMTAKNGETASSLMFGNSWKYPNSCPDVTTSPTDPCSADPVRNTQAEETCDVLKSSTFEECRRHVPYEQYFTNCKKAVCACEDGVTSCGCKALEAYTVACLAANVAVDMTESVCNYECPVKHTYQASTTRCGKTCRGISGHEYCSSDVLVTGCNCPDDLYLSSDGSCVTKNFCPCYQEGGTWIANGHQVSPSSNRVCTCLSGSLQCPIDAVFSILLEECGEDEEFIDCTKLPAGKLGAECAPSCDSGNHSCPATSCESGCRCKDGFVRDGDVCVRPENCQCSLGGVKYPIGAVVTESCRKMNCGPNSEWIVNDARCYDECTLSGGRFYRTFDGREYVFNGDCEYVMATDYCSTDSIASYTYDDYTYGVKIKSHDCPGSNQAMCLTTVTVIVGVNKFVNSVLEPQNCADPYLAIKAIKFKPHRKLDYSNLTPTCRKKVADPARLQCLGCEACKPLKQFKKYVFTLDETDEVKVSVDPYRKDNANINSIEASATTRGSYVVIDSDVGLRVTWDKRTTVYVELAKNLKSSATCGLCGNNDGDANNDLEKSTRDVTTDAIEFGNSWKVSPYCPDVINATQIECGNKLAWAEKQCNILHTDFLECHSKVSPEYFYQKCIEESCSCDAGGDCDCFCASVADYAYACGTFGITVHWRNQDICPVMCEALNTDDDCLWKYEPCPPPCPKICCAECLEGCYEGCYPECKEGLLYDPKTQTCVDPSVCNCTDINDKCDEGYIEVCEWSPWINSNYPSVLAGGEFELIDKVDHYTNSCDIRRGIECRSARDHSADLQDHVSCDVKEGLACHIIDQDPPICDDYEIRVNCCICEHKCAHVVCPPEPSCEMHEEMQTSEGECCEEYDCTCVRCVHNHEIKEPGDEWQENCTVFQCVPDGNGCFKVTSGPAGCPPLPVEECPYYAKQIVTKDPDECCSGIECVCRPEYDPSTAVKPFCTHPEIVNEISLVDGSLECVTFNCTCPDDLTDVDCGKPKNCTAPGCSHVTSSHCGCVIDSTCECDTRECLPPPICPSCEVLLTTPADSPSDPDTRCADDTCCPKYICRPKTCDDRTENLVCEEWEIKVQDDTDPCCPAYKCICDPNKCPVGKNCSDIEKPEKIELNPCCTHNTCVCVRCIDEEEYIREIGDKWPASVDPECVTMACMGGNMSTSCPQVEVYRDLHDSCPPHSHVDCPTHEKLVTFSTGPCCNNTRCDCDYPECPTDPICESGWILAPDKNASTRCCDVSKCCLNTCQDGDTTHEAGDVWRVGCERRTCECDCDTETCTIKPLLTCPEQEKPTCENHLPAVQVPNPDDSCCSMYECQCVCTVFGDPHYVTFDNTYYSFMGECHYTLVTYRESRDLHIYSDNTVCAMFGNETWTCLKSIFVEYKGSLVELTYNDTTFNYIVNVDHRRALLPRTGSLISIIYVGDRVVLTIPELDVRVEYSVTEIATAIIYIPYTKMYNQTVGLCGTCSNETKDDFECNGTQVQPTDDFGDCWLVEKNDTECVCDPVRNPACGSCDVPDPPDHCKTCEDDGCEILESDIFEDCRKIVDVTGYIVACQEDAYVWGRCDVCNSSAVKMYADLCSKEHICVDWKEEAGCPGTCKRNDMIYKACAPVCEVHMTCNDYLNDQPCNMSDTTSGCFCPDGLVLDQMTEECVEPRCCKCPEPPICPPGRELTVVEGTEDDCCPTYNCSCKEPPILVCEFPLIRVLNETSDCPSHYCDCPPSMEYCDYSIINCTHALGCKWNTTIQDPCGCPIGGICRCNPELCPVPPECGNCSTLTTYKHPLDEDTCENCCTVYQCKVVECDETYTPGYTWVKVEGECCPRNVCSACFLEDGSIKQPGEIWVEYVDHCRKTYVCSEQTGQDGCHIVVKDYDQSDNCQNESSVVCPPDHEVVPMDLGNTCCEHYGCQCLPAPTPPTCQHTGEVLTVVNTTYCYEVKECKCSPDSNYLETVCPGYDEALNQLTDETEIVTIWPEPPKADDPCCPIYVIECKICSLPSVTCKDGDMPKVKEDPDSECNCTIGWCQCYSCVDDEGNYHDVGDTITIVDDETCSITKQCTNKRPSPEDCFIWDVIHIEKDHCVNEEDFVRRNCTEYEIARLVDDSKCCDEFECVCDQTLPPVTPAVCSFPAQTLGPVYVDECIPKKDCVCVNDTDVQHSECPNYQILANSCNDPYTIVESHWPNDVPIYGPCCPYYECECKPCSETPTCPDGYITVSGECCDKCVCDSCPGDEGPHEVGSSWAGEDDLGCDITYKCMANSSRDENGCYIPISVPDVCIVKDNCPDYMHLEKILWPPGDPDDDQCCTEFGCVCNDCPADWVPPEPTPPNHIAHNITDPCCPVIVLECFVCELPDGSVVEPGTSWHTVDAEGCTYNHTCTFERINNDKYACFVVKSNDPKEHCTSKEEYAAEHCNPVYKEAITVEYGSGADPDLCCEEFKCVCKEDLREIGVCPPQLVTPEICEEDGRQPPTNSTVQNTEGCCIQLKCDCYDPSVIDPHCPGSNPKCDVGEIVHREFTDGVCCPVYTCICDSCPPTHQPHPPITPEPYQECVNKTLAENPLQKCCNECKIVCRDGNEGCPTHESCSEHEIAKEVLGQTDPVTDHCCPLYECECLKCVLPDGSAKDPGESWTTKDPEGCESTHTCLNERIGDENSCYKIDVYNPADHCQKIDDFEASHCSWFQHAVVVVHEGKDPDPCCEEFECVCNDCPPTPPPPTLEPCHEMVKNESNPNSCCEHYYVDCQACLMPDGTCLKPGDTVDIPNEDGCLIKHLCSSTLQSDGCFKDKVVLDPTDLCETKENYESKYCNATHEKAIEITYGNGDVDPDVCCPEFECVCEDDAVLEIICPQWTDYECEDERMIKVDDTPTGSCCPEYVCVCPPCPDVNSVCNSSWSLVIQDDTTYPPECNCKTTQCVCNETKCPEVFPPVDCPKMSEEPNVTDPTYFEECCPLTECVCVPEKCDLPDIGPSMCQITENRENVTGTTCCPRRYDCICKPEEELDVICPTALNLTVPPGYEVVKLSSPTSDSLNCCNHTIVCTHCVLDDGELRKPGEMWYETDENGCNITKLCTNYLQENTCHRVDTIHDENDNCISKEDYETRYCTIENQIAEEIPLEGICCDDFKCVCESYPQKPLPSPPCITRPGQIETDWIREECYEEKFCICANDSVVYEKECPNYIILESSCESNQHVEVVGDVDPIYGPCCPVYGCVCNTCPDSDPNFTCPDGWKDTSTTDSCGCIINSCECVSCYDSSGTRHDLDTDWTEVNGTGCHIKYTCEETIEQDHRTCYVPRPELLPCLSYPTCPSYSNLVDVVYTDETTDPNSCCVEKECVCNKCVLESGDLMDPGTVVTVKGTDGCPITHNCTTVRDQTHQDNCYIYESYSHERFCTKKEVYEEKNCKPTYQRATEILYGLGEVDPDDCCTEFECVCKDEVDLTAVCPPDEVCEKEDGRKPSFEYTVPNTTGCCIQVKCGDCYDPSVVDMDCPESNPNCGVGEIVHREFTDGVCCPVYTCICDSCPPTHKPHPPTTPAPYQECVNKTLAENPLQKCCNECKIVCRDGNEGCPTYDSCSEHEIAKEVPGQTDPDTDHCCPLYECECQKCILPDGSAKDPGESWTTKDPEGCESTHTCLNERIGDENSCYKIDVYNPADHCQKIGDYESSHCSWFEHAIVVVYEREDPEPCCDEFECVCNACPPTPPPPTLEPCHEMVKNESNPNSCCEHYYADCKACLMPDGTCLKPGESVDIPNEDGCPIKHLCSNTLQSDGCFKDKVVLDPTDLCETKENYESKYCNATHEKAIKITYGNGDVDPDVCCPEFECVCEDDAVLEIICPQWTDYECEDERMIKVDVTLPGSCCPEYQCVCPTCPDVNFVCNSSWSLVIRDDTTYPPECNCKTTQCVCNETKCPEVFPPVECPKKSEEPKVTDPKYFEECCPLTECVCVPEKCDLPDIGPPMCQITENRVNVTGTTCCPRRYDCICKPEEELDVICPTALNLTVPLGYEIVKLSSPTLDSLNCCNYTVVCTHCVLDNGELRKPGELWSETDENGCNITKLCTNYLQEDTCHRVDTIHDENDNCISKEDYETRYCTIENQIAEEIPLEGICCDDFKCVCESYPQKPLPSPPCITRPGQIETDWIREECYEEKFCICANDSVVYEKECPNYNILESSCESNQHVEVVGDVDPIYGPCCPVYGCVCNTCPDSDPNFTCPDGWKDTSTTDSCGCIINSCECVSCYDSSGTRHDLDTDWTEVNGTGCHIKYTCEETIEQDHRTCYVPRPELLPCLSYPTCPSYSNLVDVVYTDETTDPNSCCVEKECVCNKCVLESGDLMDPGTVVTVEGTDGCPVTHNCTTVRDQTHQDNCYIYESYSHERFCTKKEVYEEKNCKPTYQRATEILYGLGEVDPDDCCTEFECVCKDEVDLTAVCPPDEVCEKEDGRKPSFEYTVPNTEGCCIQVKCGDCYDPSVVDTHCPESNLNCGVGEIVHREFTDGVCCPVYTCICDSCPPTHQPHPPTTPAPYQECVNKTLAENPLQKCCNECKIVCRDDNEGCPTHDSCSEHEIAKEVPGQTDPVTDHCCPLYECECLKCVLPDGSAKDPGESWTTTVVSGCESTHTCLNERMGDENSCYKIDVYNPADHCQKIGDYESSHCSWFEHAVVVVHEGEDPDPCCDEFECVCNDCGPTPPPPILAPCHEMVKNVSNPNSCCEHYYVDCKACLMPDGSCHSPGDAVEIPNADGCPITYLCSSKSGTDGCFISTVSIDPTKSCESKDDYESRVCDSTYEAAIEIVYGVGDTDPNVCCPEFKCVCKDGATLDSVCPILECPDHQSPVEVPDSTDPATRDCCPLYECVCDEVCIFPNGTAVPVGHSWKEDVGDGCLVTWNCTDKMAAIEKFYKAAAPVVSCYSAEMIKDPRLACKSETQFDEMYCTDYQKAIIFEPEVDIDPCCNDYKCVCKDDNMLEPICPDFNGIDCPDNMHPVASHYINNTSECCPGHKCVCVDEGSLAVTCSQWYDYTCPEAMQRVTTTEPNYETGPCCPTFDCYCLPTSNLSKVCEQWDFTCPLGDRRVRTNSDDECCPEYECLCDKCVFNEQTYSVGTSFTNSEDHCEVGTCELDLNTNCPKVVLDQKYECAPFDEEECTRTGGMVALNETTQGCCKYCIPNQPCIQHTKEEQLNTTIDSHRCWSNDIAHINYCEGSCPATHIVNSETGLVEGECRCCLPSGSVMQRYSLFCDDGSRRDYDMEVILGCACATTPCVDAKETTSDNNEETVSFD